MKVTIVLFFLAVVVSLTTIHQSSAQLHPYRPDPEIERRKELPPEVFKDRQALTEWGKTSSWGGGTVEEFTAPQGEKIIAVYRSYTSREKSADLTVYTWDDSTKLWIYTIHHRPILGDSIKASVQGVKIVFRTTENGKVLLEIPFPSPVPVATRASLREVEIHSLIKTPDQGR